MIKAVCIAILMIGLVGAGISCSSSKKDGAAGQMDKDKDKDMKAKDGYKDKK